MTQYVTAIIIIIIVAAATTMTITIVAATTIMGRVNTRHWALVDPTMHLWLPLLVSLISLLTVQYRQSYLDDIVEYFMVIVL